MKKNNSSFTFGACLFLLSIGAFIFLFIKVQAKTVEDFASETGVVKIDDQIFPQQSLEALRQRELNGQLPIEIKTEDHTDNNPFNPLP